MGEVVSIQIGELAKRAGVSIRTVRYYEELGLLQPSGWTSGGMRLYSNTDIARLRFIRRLRILRLSLNEIKLALGQKQIPLSRQEKVERTLQVLLLEQNRLDEQTTVLTQLKEELEDAIGSVRKCTTCKASECAESCPRQVYLL